ncbi:1,4-alpha-glucan branching protein [Streptomyces sp. AV19]|uniref:maltokinase N-terminal cap-like domain-containing protein n=1 Tax=Streptomyces sp. AV19 TaxID=2793068 RepID=UPI0018FE9978|nr:1,4-alpha-glucan branching protein [Streptomyces sp. AV19]MBH1937404.1 1,4-alpha-glucan branching protein [Streptomyces sp. AV19]MDG4533823.1 1,4-alpha-glucan branching protein [Streptomyces sp. AV19]
MAVIHHTTVVPSKDELLTAWLPTRPWYRPAVGAPKLERAGGFRLDDPAGEVGIEFMAVTDTAGAGPVTYLVPVTYRGAPLKGAEDALVGTMEHGVLGTRWAYDGCHDPVLVDGLLALIEGRAQAQDQNTSDAPDPGITRSFTGNGPVPADLSTVTDDRESTTLTGTSQDVTLRLNRVLRPGTLPQGATGQVTGWWRQPDGTRAQGPFAVLHCR